LQHAPVTALGTEPRTPFKALCVLSLAISTKAPDSPNHAAWTHQPSSSIPRHHVSTDPNSSTMPATRLHCFQARLKRGFQQAVGYCQGQINASLHQGAQQAPRHSLGPLHWNSGDQHRLSYLPATQREE